MSSDGFGYDVDLAELSAVTADLDQSQQRLRRQLDALDTLVAGLRQVWTGAAATSQQDAHARWSRDARAMHEALTVLHGAAATAQQNYTGAVEANLQMWRQVL